MKKLHPSTDLHLLRGMSVTLDLLFNAEDTVHNDWVRGGGFQLALGSTATPPLVTVAGLTITASATQTGSIRAFLEIQSPLAAPVTTGAIPVRISVHKTLHKLWCSSHHHKLETGRSDRVLVVYAEFEAADGSRVIADVTGRDFLAYPHTPPDGLTVGDDGRVTTTAATGTWTVTIDVKSELKSELGISPTTGSVTIEVVAAPTDLPILVRHHEGTEESRRSILLIAEGWTAPLEEEFHLLCRVLIKKLKQTQPYARLAESFDVYAAFVPSAEEGISVGADVVRPGATGPAFVLMPDDSPLAEVVRQIGHPDSPGAPTFASAEDMANAAHVPLTSRNRALWQQTFDAWTSLGTARPTRIRDTAFGLMITYPHRGPYVPEILGPSPATWPNWLSQSVLPRGPARAPFFPDHRLPPLLGTPPVDPEQAHTAMLDAFLGKLRLPGGPTDTGKRWQAGGDSEGMAVFLSRCDLYGGVAIPRTVVVSTGNQPIIGVVNSSIHTTPTPHDYLLDVVAGTTSSFQERPLREMADVLAHELAHTEAMGRLHDEYGGQTMPSSIPLFVERFVEAKPNAHMLANVQGAGSSIDTQALKWRWPRVEAGAVVKNCSADGTEVVFEINLSHALRWKKLSGNQPVWVRNGPLWQEWAPVGPIHDNPLQLEFVSFDPAQRVVRCRPIAPVLAADVVTSFWTLPSQAGPPDVRIVLQRVDAANQPLWLISPAVAAALAAGPLLETSADCKTLGVIDRRAGVAGLRSSTPAAYEGGATSNCEVIRPSAECKLSRRMGVAPGLFGIPYHHAEKFCAVCEYVMTYQLDVSCLPGVDRLL